MNELNSFFQPNITVRTYRHDGLQTENFNTGNCVEIDIVLSGDGVHRLADKFLPCKEGDVFILSPETKHSYAPKNDFCISRILFEPELCLSGNASVEKHPHFCYGVFCEGTVSYAALNKEVWDDTLFLVRKLSSETEKKRSDWEVSANAYLTSLLISLSRYMNGAIKNTTSSSRWNKELVSTVLRIVNEEYTSSSLTLESLSSTLHVSPAHLSRLFRESTGKHFSEYLRDMRLKHACHLLEETDMTVENVVSKCGLKDLPSFYKSFRKYVGTSPNQYRKSHNKNKLKGEKIMSILNEISENLQKGKARVVKDLVSQAIAEGCEPSQILKEGLLSGMSVIGEKFKNNEVFVPEVLVAARAMNMGVEILKPLLASNGVEAVGKVCIGTVQGDLHDIGKNLVRMMLEGKGLEVIDLGVDVPPETFIKTAIEENCQIICCSALLTTTMPEMENVVKAAQEAGIRDKVKIMVGGAPVNEDFCKAIGADCYTVDASSAADAAVEFCTAMN